MSQFRLGKSSGTGETRSQSIKENKTRNWGIVVTLLSIVSIALILRVFFAYDYAAVGGFSLSGGTNAAYHLRAIEYILETGKQLVLDPSLNFPFDQLNPNPFLMDWAYAGVAKIVTFFGVSTSVAASGTLVWASAILGALTCIPVYLIGKNMFSKAVGLVAALLYGVCAMTISNTVMSNGTEAAFYGFFFAWMIYFLFKAVKMLGNEHSEDARENIFRTNRRAVKYALFAGVMLAIVALSWSGFRPIAIMVAAIMLVHAVLNRIRKKDGVPIFTIYALTLLVGMVIAAPFYMIQDLWDLVFSGPFLFSLMAVGVAAVIAYTRKLPWLTVVPLMAVLVAAVFVVMYFVVPDLYSDILFGNAIYFDPTYKSLVGSNYISLSAMAGYYGWFTLWTPYILVAYMAYRMPQKAGSSTHMFIMMWVISMLVIGWSSVQTAFLAAPAYAIGGGAVIVWIVYKAKIKEYFASFKGTGFHFKPLFKKFFKPVPLLSVLMVVFLVGAPNAIYAIDASISSNEKAKMGDEYIGAMGYFVKNDTDWKMNDVWHQMNQTSKDGALVSWWDYSPDAASLGGFDNVAGLNGAGASAASNILLADSSSAYIVAMAIRLMDYYNVDDFKTALATAGISGAEYNRLKEILDNPAGEIGTIVNDPDAYGRFSSNLSEENAKYISAIHYIISELEFTQTDCINLYEEVSSVKGDRISYFAVSRSMFPIVYNDGSAFSTLAYMNNYYLDANGAPTNFYTMNSYGYYDYTAEMYNSFLWKAYIGPAPSDYGYYSAIEMFNAMTLSNGSDNTRAQPGYGIPNTEIAYWKVMYNPADDATLDSDGWVEMDALGTNGAIAKQKADGGLINYLSGLPVVLKFVEGGSNVVTGTVLDASGDGVDGARVAVFDANGIQKNTIFTKVDKNGDAIPYEVDAPYAGGRIEVSLGSSTMRGGLMVDSWNLSAVASPHVTSVNSVDFDGVIYYDDTKKTPATTDFTVSIVGSVHGMEMETTAVTPVAPDVVQFSFTGLVPDRYTITVRDALGASVGTGTYEATLGLGGVIQVEILMNKSTINLDIKDQWNVPLSTDEVAGTGYVLLQHTTEPYSRMVKLENGKAEVQVLPGTYTASLVNADSTPYLDLALFNASVTVATSDTKTLTAQGLKYHTLSLSFNPVSSLPDSLGVQISTGTVTVNAVLSKGVTNNILVPAGQAENDYIVTGTYVSGDQRRFVMWSYTADETTGTVSHTLVDSDVSDAYNVSGKLKTSSDRDVTGTIMVFDKITGAYRASVWTSDGEYSMWLPSGNYYIYAYGETSLKEAFIGELKVEAAEKTQDIKMVSANRLTTRVVAAYSGSSASSSVPLFQIIPFTLQNGSDDATVFKLTLSTTANGSYEMYLPKEKYTVTVDGTIDGRDMRDAEGGIVKKTADLTSADYSATFNTKDTTYFSGRIIFVDKDETAVVPELPVGTTFKVSGVSGEFTLTDAGEFVFTDADKVPLGSRTITLTPTKTSPYYYSASAVFYMSGNDIKVEFTSMYYAELDNTTLGETDVVTVEKLGVKTGEYQRDNADGSQLYYFEKGREFQFKVTDKDDTKVWYQFVDESITTTPLTVSLKESIEVTGYVGYAGSGILTVTSAGLSSKIVISVPSTGVYKATLPMYDTILVNNKYDLYANVVYVTDSDPVRYSYNGGRTNVGFFEIQESYVANLAVTGEPEPAATKDIRAEVDGTISYNSATEEFEFAVKLTDDTVPENFRSMMLSGGTAWDEVKFYSDVARTNEVNLIDGPGTFYVTGKVAKDTAYDNTGLSVIFRTPDGTSILTYSVEGLGAAVPAADVNAGDITIGKGEFDYISEYEHRFSVTINNESLAAKDFKMNFKSTIPAGWMVVLTDSSGSTIRTWDTADTFTVKGKTESTFYVKLITERSSAAMPDDFEVTVQLTDTAFPQSQIKAGDDTTVAGYVATIKVTPHDVDLGTEDNSASGPNIFNFLGTIPMTVWAMVVLAVIMLLFVFWQGSKRGVLSRRN